MKYQVLFSQKSVQSWIQEYKTLKEARKAASEYIESAWNDHIRRYKIAGFKKVRSVYKDGYKFIEHPFFGVDVSVSIFKK